MFEILLKDIDKNNIIDFDYLVNLSNNYSGADINEFVEQLKMMVIKRKIKDIDSDELSMNDVYLLEKSFKSSTNIDELNYLKRFLMENKNVKD